MNRGAPRVTPESVLQRRRRRPKHRILPIPSAVPGLTRHRASSRGLQPLAIATAPTCSTLEKPRKGGGGRQRAPAGSGAGWPAGGAPCPPCSSPAVRQVRARGGGLPLPEWLGSSVSAAAGTATLAWPRGRSPSRLWPGRTAGTGSADRHRASHPKARPLRPRQTLAPTLQMQKLGSPNYKWQVRSRPGAWVLQRRPCTMRGGGRGRGSGARRWIRARAPAR